MNTKNGTNRNNDCIVYRFFDSLDSNLESEDKFDFFETEYMNNGI